MNHGSALFKLHPIGDLVGGHQFPSIIAHDAPRRYDIVIRTGIKGDGIKGDVAN
jgi:hypothetical protein